MSLGVVGTISGNRQVYAMDRSQVYRGDIRIKENICAWTNLQTSNAVESACQSISPTISSFSPEPLDKGMTWTHG